MRSIPVIVDSHLRLDGNLIGHDLANEIFDELTIHNVARDVAERMGRYGWWNLPEEFQLGWLDGDTVVMPRGYAFQLKTLLRMRHLRVQWIDRRQWQRGPAFSGNGKVLKPHQQVAVRKMIKHQQGMYEAPTGSGKTVTCIGLIMTKQPKWTLILVDQIGLLNQWRKQLATWLGCDIEEIGTIGDQKRELGKRVTVATVQTINSLVKTGELGEDFFNVWDCVILDECHHVSAETIREIMDRFNAKLRLGTSATADRKDDKFEFALNILGEVFWQDSEEELRAEGLLMRPHVRVIRTAFEHDYWPDHESDEDDECQVPGCRLSGVRPHQHRNNYQAVKSALVENEERNRLIINTLVSQINDGEHHHLIVSDEIRQLDALKEALWDAQISVQRIPGVFTMTGQVKGRERVEIKEAIERSASAIIFATVAKEGLDIPAVDRIYLPFPANNPAKVQQWIGRGTRIHEGKTDILVFDFFDINVSIFKKQFRNRRFQCYDKLNLEVDLGH